MTIGYSLQMNKQMQTVNRWSNVHTKGSYPDQQNRHGTSEQRTNTCNHIKILLKCLPGHCNIMDKMFIFSVNEQYFIFIKLVVLSLP